jgi:hypothetical protein
MTLDEGRWQSMERISVHVATTYPGASGLTTAEKYEVAMDALVEFVAESGWPAGDFRDMYRFANMRLAHAGREAIKHRAFAAYWVNPAAEPFTDRADDRIGVNQLTHAFSDTEWEAVWSLAISIGLGEDQAAAGRRIGISYAAMAQRLHQARRHAYGLWVSPGDTPFVQWRANRRRTGGTEHKAARAKYARDGRARRRAA